MDRLIGAFDMRVAGEVALQRHLSVNVGEGEVAAIAVDRHFTLDVMRRHVALVGNPGMHMAGDRSRFEIAMR